MSFIKQIDVFANPKLMIDDMNHIINSFGWPLKKGPCGDMIPSNQISLRHRQGALNPWSDSNGPLEGGHIDTPRPGQAILSSGMAGKEIDFAFYPEGMPEFTKNKLEELSEKEGVKFGRIRYMRLMPKTGFAVHADNEPRYHFVMVTNPCAYFGEAVPKGDIVAQCHHMPVDGYFYKVDTTRPHFVYNGGYEPRIHLVINIA
jgi:hypothetical protein